MNGLTDAQLLERLHRLSPDKQAEVFDFIEFLASRTPQAEAGGLPPIDDLAGKLTFAGDPVAFQRELRDEWR